MENKELSTELENRFSINDISKEEKLIFREMWFLTIEFLSDAKANIFKKVNFKNIPKRLKQILDFNSFFRFSRVNRKDAIKFGMTALIWYENIYNQIIIKKLNPITIKYQDNVLVEFSGTEMGFLPDTTKHYDYFYFKLNSNGTVTTIKSFYFYEDNKWQLDSDSNKPSIINYDDIPAYVFSNRENFESSFVNLKFLIGLLAYNWFKILEDLQLGTNKFVLNLRGVPGGSNEFFEYVSKYKKVLKKGSIISDDMIMINPNSDNPLNRAYGSLQTDQLMYSQKMIWGMLREMFFVMSGGNGKISTQQNSTEIVQESIIVYNDDLTVKDIWENQYLEFINKLKRFDIMYLNNGDLYDSLMEDIECEIILQKSVFEMEKEMRGQNNGN